MNVDVCYKVNPDKAVGRIKKRAGNGSVILRKKDSVGSRRVHFF